MGKHDFFFLLKFNENPKSWENQVFNLSVISLSSTLTVYEKPNYNHMVTE